MKKIETIKSKDDFSNIIRKGKYLKGKYFVIYYLPNDSEKNMYAVAVSKKIGDAVTRNYYKRIYRNIIDENKFLFKKGQKYIIMIKTSSLNGSFKEISENFRETLEKSEL